jgi:Cu(I)/Ag(I) efflux system membrane fusion protein
MKKINIHITRKEWIRGGLLVGAGILLGALVFTSSGESDQASSGKIEEQVQKTSETAGEEGTVYTCSMHPQVRQDEPGDCPICGMELIPAEEADQDEGGQAELKMTETAMQIAQVQTSEVTRKRPEKEIRLTGKIEVDERKVYTQPSHFPGRIEKLYVEFKGEYVRKGQVIASVYSPDLIAAQEELLEALKTKESNPELLEAARAKLRQWKLNDEQIRAIEERGTVSEQMKIKSDVSGVVHKQMINEGDYVKKGSILYHIARINKVWVMFDAYQQDVPLIEEGDLVDFTVSSMPGKTFTSKVTFIDPIMNEKSRVARVRTEAANTKGHLKPGMFAEGVLHADNIADGPALVVPESAVMWTGKRSVVYVQVPDREKPTFELREVTLGPALADSYIIEQGLSEGEEVVTHGTFAVDAAAQLAGKSSMMNQKGGATSTGHQHGGHEMESGSGQQAAMEMPESEASDLKWPDSESDNYKTLVDKYLTLKNRLVNDQGAGEQAGELLRAAKAVDMNAFSNNGHMKWMEVSETIKNKAERISKANKLEEQRKHFIQLSDAMISLVKAFDAPENTLFVQFCPMADDNQGAFWLSSEDQVRNPYYGDQMLTCGEVREEVKKKR